MSRNILLESKYIHPEDDYLKVVMAEYKGQYVTWIFNASTDSYGTGHYHGAYWLKAFDDYIERVNSDRTFNNLPELNQEEKQQFLIELVYKLNGYPLEKAYREEIDYLYTDVGFDNVIEDYGLDDEKLREVIDQHMSELVDELLESPRINEAIHDEINSNLYKILKRLQEDGDGICEAL